MGIWTTAATTANANQTDHRIAFVWTFDIYEKDGYGIYNTFRRAGMTSTRGYMSVT